MLDQIKKDIEKLLRTAGVEGEIELTTPPNPDLGDVAFGCFGLAKIEKKSPAEVAKHVTDTVKPLIKKSGLVTDVRFAGPYVNFFLSTPILAAQLIKHIQKEGDQFGASKQGKKKQVLIEYPSNNTHKEFHIGHFRNICIGNTLVQLYKKSGYTPVPISYLNDFGAHVVRCLWGMKKFHAGEVPPANKQQWLGEIYAEASQYAKAHADDVKGDLDRLQKQLETKDEKIWPLFLETRQWSIDGFAKIFAELGVVHDQVFYESDTKEYGQKIVDTLLKKKIASVGEGGAIIVDLTSEGLGIALARKSTGGGLYLTSDLALAEVKFKKYKKSVESIVITGTEQNQYFKQLFAILAKHGLNKKMTHIGYGLINTTEGKMSSRLGNVILYEDLKVAVMAAFQTETAARHPDWSPEKIATVVRTLTFATLKFTMQKHEAEKVIVFDIKDATSFEGYTAPYVLYTVARINSLVKKAQSKEQKTTVNVAALTAPEEKKVLLQLATFPEVIAKALANYNPSVIAKYCFDTAQVFNELYNKVQIIDESNPAVTMARLALCASVRTVLVNALDVLTIDTVDEM